MLRSFADVQKLLQISIFFLESGRLCSLLFAWVGVKLMPEISFCAPLIGALSSARPVQCPGWSNVLLWRVQLAVSYSLSSGGGATT
jgi:hypothetical protein